MDWPTVVVQSWEQFVGIIAMSYRANAPSTPAHAFRPTYLWRGQVDSSWLLEPSLRRIVGTDISFDDALAVEDELLHAFKTRAHVYVDSSVVPAPNDILSWWGLMQHYGVPTRALDWSESAYVAAYFAVEGRWDADGAVFMFAGLKMADRSFEVVNSASTEFATFEELFRSASAPSTVVPWPPWKRSERLIAQQGRFTVSTRLLGSQSDSIRAALCEANRHDLSDDLLKIEIPSALKANFLYHLRSMNVSAGALFPGADGLGRSLAEQARLASAVLSGGLKLSLPDDFLAARGRAHTEADSADPNA